MRKYKQTKMADVPSEFLVELNRYLGLENGIISFDKASVLERINLLETAANVLLDLNSPRLTICKILSFLSDLTQDCGDERLFIFAKCKLLVKALLFMMSLWLNEHDGKSPQTGDDHKRGKRINHSLFHSTAYILIAMVSGSELCNAFAMVS